MATETHKTEMPTRSSRRPHFLVTFRPDSTSQRLNIPFKFINHMEGKTSGSVSLIGPSEKTWHVDLVQQKDSLFFHDGWPEFVSNHFIEFGDTLVFRYDGSMQFTVQIFDQSSCEKDSAFLANCSQEPSDIDNSMGKKRERERDGSTSSDKISESQPKKVKISFEDLVECITKNSEAEVEKSDKECQEIVMAESCQEPIHETEECGNPSKNYAIPTEANPCTEKPEAPSKNRRRAQDEQSSRPRGCGSNYSARDEEKVAQSYPSSFPYFVRIMKRFNVSGSYTLKIPFEFSMAHLPKCKIKVILHNIKGESWTVNSVPTTRVHTSHTLCGGWMAFVRGNDIKVDDICIFELVRKCELRVNILGEGREWLKGLREKVNSDGLPNGCSATSHRTVEGSPKKIKEKCSKIPLEYSVKMNSSGKKMSKTRKEAGFSKHIKKCGSESKSVGKYAACSQSKACYEKIETTIQNESREEVELGSKAKVCMSIMLTSDKERAAQSFNSSFPNFVRVMKKFNISGSYTLKVPHQFSLAHLPNCRTEVVLRNSKGECWTVNSIPALKRQPVHTFCGGWMAFVRGNNVKIGDICIFELVSKGEMLVHIPGVGEKVADHQNGNGFL